MAAPTTNTKKRAVKSAVGTRTDQDTCAFGTDGLNRNSPPRTSVTTPPTVGNPSPGCFSSRRKNTAEARSRTMPMSCTGRTSNDTNAATSEITPKISAIG